MIYLGVEYGVKFVLEGPYGTRAVFNDSTDADYVGDLTPESSGLDAPEIREDSNDRVESDGAIFGDFFSGKRPVILQGNIIATSKAQRNERVGKLRAASNAKTADATLSWEDAAAGKVFVNLRRQQPLRITKGWAKEFQLSMVASDSRILAYNKVTKTAKGITVASQEKSPGAAGGIEGTGSAGPWVNPNNVKANDAAYATFAALSSNNAITQWFWANTYGFTVPTTAVILGVEVKPEAKASANSFMYLSNIWISRNASDKSTVIEDRVGAEAGAGLKKGATDFTFTSLTTADAVQTIGSTTDLWKYAKYLTPALVNSTAFGAGLYYEEIGGIPGASTSLDWLPIKITYAEPMKAEPKNEGDVAGPAVITIKGPLENFYIRNETTGEFLTYAGKIESGKELVIDTENVTVVEKGTGITTPINRFANVGIPNDWIKIAPGTNIILVAGSGGTAATEILVEFRHAWE